MHHHDTSTFRIHDALLHDVQDVDEVEGVEQRGQCDVAGSFHKILIVKECEGRESGIRKLSQNPDISKRSSFFNVKEESQGIVMSS